MADPGAQIVAGILAGILGAMQPHYIPSPPGTCDSAGRCYPWYDDRRIVIAPQHRFYSPPQYYPPPPPAQQSNEGTEVKAAIYEFCSRHPEEKFCGMLEAYLEHHPDAR